MVPGAPGTVVSRIVTTTRSTGSCMARGANLSWSSAVLRVVDSRPLAPAYVVRVIPSSAVASFIFTTNASWLPASQRASSRATLLPDGSSISSSSLRWLSRCPSRTGAVDSLSECASCAASRSTLISGPVSPSLSECPLRITYAVITFVTLAIGTGCCPPVLPNGPMPLTSTLAWPSCGHGS